MEDRGIEDGLKMKIEDTQTGREVQPYLLHSIVFSFSIFFTV